jgi:hypothetical protein
VFHEDLPLYPALQNGLAEQELRREREEEFQRTMYGGYDPFTDDSKDWQKNS